MKEPIAHLKKEGDRIVTQPLHEHAMAVSRLAGQFALPFSSSLWAKAAGLLHDLGKARAPFQEMLRKERVKGKDTQHAVYGAATAFAHESLPLAFAVAGHHAGLHDIACLKAAVGKVDDQERDELADTELMRGLTFPVEKDLPFRLQENEEGRHSLEFFTRMIFSCLVDADRLDAAFWEKLGTKTTELADSHPKLDAGTLLSHVLAECDKKQRTNPDSPMAEIRNRILAACLEAGNSPARGTFFSLTVPTGGGKTLAGMAFALAHAKQHNLRRVIVVIPYLSIIEQNALEYRKILDPVNRGLVLECHSAVKPRENPTEDEKYSLELLTENWDAPVIVTTSVQFLESLFAATPSRARKLHNIAESVVIFDEVQTLPAHLLSPALNVFRELASSYRVSFVFSSATQPAFRHSPNLPDGFQPSEIQEIAPAPERLFAELRRVSYHLPRPDETLGWNALADRLAAEPQCLCVVNLTRHARSLWDKLNEKISDQKERPVHLSSAMCPAHRLAVIRQIRCRLKTGRPCRVISTQLIEAGVDVDFPVVWRAMGPLDSIVQVAGRCNREGKLVDESGRSRFGDVHVFTPTDNKLPGGIYSTATGQAAVTLAGLGDQADARLAADPGIFTQYFSALFSLVNTDYAQQGENTIQHDRAELRFRTVAEKAVVIKDGGTPVIIPIGYASHYVEKLRARQPAPDEPRFTRDDLRRLQRYMVNIRQRDFNFYYAKGLLSNLLPNLEIFVLDTCQYNRHLGIIKPDNAPPLEDFLL